MARKQTRLAVIDSYILVRHSVSKVMEAVGFNVTIQAEDGDDFISQAVQTSDIPDACLLDIDTPTIAEYKIGMQIKRKFPGIKVFAYTVYEKEYSETQKYGIDVFLKKGCSPEEIKAHILKAVQC